MAFAITVKKEFKAMHNIRYADGRVDEPHWHNWIAEVHIESITLSREGLVMDFAIVDDFLDEIVSIFKNEYINEIKPFNKINPTAEKISEWLYHELRKKIKSPARLTRVVLWEGKERIKKLC